MALGALKVLPFVAVATWVATGTGTRGELLGAERRHGLPLGNCGH